MRNSIFGSERPWVTSMGLGAVAGLRSMMAPALLSRWLQHRSPKGRGVRAALWLAKPLVSRTLPFFALAEMVADKHPDMPSRVKPLPLLGRAAMGAAIGLIAGGRHRFLNAAAGAAGAVIASFAGNRMRRAVSGRGRVVRTLAALSEDGFAYMAGRTLLSRA